jgi:exodeoxyribonuclease VII large subunit
LNQSRQILKANHISLHHYSEFLKTQVKEFIKTEKKMVSSISETIEKIAQQKISHQKSNINSALGVLKLQSKIKILLSRKSLDLYYHQIRLQNPRNVLKRGYSLTKKNGQLLKDISTLKKGDVIETTYFNGQSESKIEYLNKKE